MTAPNWRRGRLLVASPSLIDPNFHRTVVLLLEHSTEGALGVVLNRPSLLNTRETLPDTFAESIPADELLWSAVLDRKGGNFRLVARMPMDPSLN